MLRGACSRCTSSTQPDLPEPAAGGQGDVIAYAPLSLVPVGGRNPAVRPRGVRAAVYEGPPPRLLQWGPLMLVLGLLFTWGAAESVRRPLALLTRAAERIAAGRPPASPSRALPS